MLLEARDLVGGYGKMMILKGVTLGVDAVVTGRDIKPNHLRVDRTKGATLRAQFTTHATEVVTLDHTVGLTLQRIATMMDAEELSAAPHLVSGVTDISVAEGGEKDAAEARPEKGKRGR